MFNNTSYNNKSSGIERSITKMDFKSYLVKTQFETIKELREDRKAYNEWIDEEFKKYVIENKREELFPELFETKEETEKAPAAEVITESENIIDIKPEEVVEKTLTNINNIISADSLHSDEIVEPKKEIVSGLSFDHLVVPSTPTGFQNSVNVIENQSIVNNARFDNSNIISAFPDMGKIQEIIRTTDKWDVEMLPLYNDFIICTLYENNVATDKIFIVDYKGHFLNNLPKIFLIEEGFIDESQAIHFSDTLNLLNYLKGVKITQSQTEIVTPEQRKIAKYIINYGPNKVAEEFKNEFEKFCIERLLPFIENQILPTNPNAAFSIENFTDLSHWDLKCNPMVPYRFGENGGVCNNTIYIHADGTDKDGHVLITPTFA